jgi:DHA3 family macrolide efflux protein-like MFS transporter
MLNFLLSPTSAFTPLIVTDVFHKGAVELGWTRAAFGAGIILAGLILSAWGGFKRRIVTSLCGVIGVSLGVLLFGLAPTSMFPSLLAAGFLQGFAVVFANGPLQAILQTTVAPEVQGRVFSLLGAGAAAMMPLGLLIAGPVADWLGVRSWYIMGGSICMLVAIVATFVPVIMNIEENRIPVESSPSAETR